ncbi:MAG: hypothetical protein ABIM99_03185 [Candidatus Dojkabacteria bacterium]
MSHVAFFIFVLVASFFWAMMEIQIEGKDGWAAALPTWRYKIYLKYIWEREITGYHFFLMSFILVLLHSVFIFFPWTIGIEFRILAFFLILGVIEDFLWFILNPAFGLKKFNRIEVPWHSMWFLGIPTFYWVFLPLGFFLYSISLTL